MRKSYQIIHEDEDLVVLDKSGHVLTIQDRFDPIKKNLRSMMINRFGQIYVVHRLDYETSGVIVFAKNEAAHKDLSEQFQNRTVLKKYQALCLCPLQEEGLIEYSIVEHKSKKGHYTVGDEGKVSTTHFKVLKKLDKYALLELTPHTGRTHQIRVHLQHNGTPLLTDKKYGIHSAFYLSQIKKVKMRRDQTEQPLLGRSALHSASITFKHPGSQDQVTFEASLHKDMKAVIYQLEKKLNN